MLLATLGFFPSTVAAAGDGVIEGQVKNATAGAPAPAGVEIVLHAVGDDQRVERRLATADADGRYRFDGLDTAATVKYLPAVDYAGALYFARPVSLNEQPRQSADITVYESTRSEQWIAFERSNVLIQGIAADRLDLMEMGAVANVGDRTYVGPAGPAGESSPTLRFAVPAGAYDVTPRAGFMPNDVSMLPNGFTIGSPIVPGRHQLAFSYSLPFASDRLDVSKRIEYPTLTFNLYVPDVGLQVDSPQLTPLGPADFGGQRFQVYGAQSVAQGSELRIRLGGLPSSNSGSQSLVWSVIGLGCTALGAGLFLVHRRRLTTSPAHAATAGNGLLHDYETLEIERMRLLVGLARLDERHELGELSDEQYEQERERGKRQLVALGRQRPGAEAGGN